MANTNEFDKKTNIKNENHAGNEDAADYLLDPLKILKNEVKIIKKYLLIFLLVILLSISVFLLRSAKNYSEIYEVNSSFSITPLYVESNNSGLANYQFNYTSAFAGQMAKTFSYIVSSDNLRSAMSSDLGGYVNGSISISYIDETNIFRASVQSSNPTDATNVMNSFIKTFPNISEYMLGDVKIDVLYQSPTPNRPINNKAKTFLTSAVKGGLIALFLELLVLFIVALRQENVSTSNDVKYKLNGKCICEIPHIMPKRNKKGNILIKIGHSHAKFSETIRSMNRRLKGLVSENDKVIGFTSAVGGEGRTTVSYNLARSMADENKKILLIDFNSKNIQLNNLTAINTKDKSGISDYLSGKCKTDDLICKHMDNFDVIFSGNDSINFSNHKLVDMMIELRKIYDKIIVDMVPCTAGVDVSLLSDICDAVVMVIKSDDTSISTIRKGLKLLSYGSSKFIGYVLNDCEKASVSAYGYYSKYRRYGYGNYRKYGYYKGYNKDYYRGYHHGDGYYNSYYSKED